jgi:hypothetical protein
MNIKYMIIMLSALFIISTIQGLAINNVETTNLEISDVKGEFGGVTAIITNTGDVTAEKFAISIFVEGGFLDNIDISQICSGCGDCGTTIPVGESKAESTTEAGFIFGIGPVDILVTASAENAEIVSMSTTGFVLGPFVII